MARSEEHRNQLEGEELLNMVDIAKVTLNNRGNEAVPVFLASVRQLWNLIFYHKRFAPLARKKIEELSGTTLDLSDPEKIENDLNPFRWESGDHASEYIGKYESLRNFIESFLNRDDLGK